MYFDAYERAVQGHRILDSLVFVRPNNLNNGGAKDVFYINQVGADKFLCVAITNVNHTFVVDEDYLRRRILPLDVQLAYENDLEELFKADIYHKIRYTDEGWFETRTHQAKEAWKVKREQMQISGELDEEPEKGTKSKSNEDKNMSRTNKVVNNVKNANIDAVKVTARLGAGKALNASVQEKIVPKLPMMVRGYAQSELGKIVMANMAATALSYYAPDSEKAKMVSEAMIQSAMVDLLAIVDIEGMVKEFLNSDAAKTITDAAKED